jgi:hypothetical protein
MISAPSFDLHAISHHIVKSAIEAMNGRNKNNSIYALFSDNSNAIAERLFCYSVMIITSMSRIFRCV